MWKKYAMHTATIIGMILTLAFIAYGIHKKIFVSQAALSQFLLRFGIYAPLIFLFFQAVQVVVPVLPGGIACLGGVLLFGTMKGFFLNYFGICIGSVIAFLLARHYGRSFVQSISKKETFEKYENWLHKKKSAFEKWFALAIFFPIAPDDFLCYLAGLTKMSTKKFTMIIFLAKPFGILAYTWGLQVVFQHLLKFFA